MSGTEAVHGVGHQKRIEGAPGQALPKVVAAGAEAVEQGLEGSSVEGHRPIREQLQQVAPVVAAGEGNPLRAGNVAAHQWGGSQSPGQRGRINAFDCMPREVHTRGCEEPHGLLCVQVGGQVEPKVESPCPTENARAARHREAQLDGPQQVDVLPQRPIAHCLHRKRRLLAQKTWELGVQRENDTMGLATRHRCEQLVKLGIEVPRPDFLEAPCAERNSHRMQMVKPRRRGPPSGNPHLTSPPCRGAVLT
mmetsp:Transcript_131912/g.282092  ORF Transcript_131912/g.282092 Transcript_131912/m.282092 type:complete len:250 (-) Transcript_131912:52-801(-)